SSFSPGGKLDRYTASPVPAGVDGNSKSDNKSHGVIPTGGTAQSSGMCASKTTLAVFAEPTTTTTPPDDDNDNSSDTTIDFGFWHPYSLGNRVWLDKDNSGDINPADGPTPGIANVVVDLYDCSGNKLNTTVTDTEGHYRFDDLDAGCYQAEVVQSNFTNNTTLTSCNMSSTGPKQSVNPDNNIDSDDNGLDVPADTAVRTGSMHLGPFNSAPTGEADLAVSGQGTDDDFANMTLDLGFICDPKLATTGENSTSLLLLALSLPIAGTLLARRQFGRL
ncbi:MAG TPA: SdrD B-like domain-containing protein, partial [Candidatus Saccharimonadales bacterium]|nr:SdrD B-like domain-containing protein [Candidatus Saccharimonadales bacterium]